MKKIIFVLMALMLVSGGSVFAAGYKTGDQDGTPDRIQDKLRLKDGSCQSVVAMNGIRDQLRQRLKDGSCLTA